MVDSAYEPTRLFCDGMLKRFGVETSYYDPLVGAGIAALIRPDTKLIFLESPGSLTFEVQDVAAIVAVAREKGVFTMLDNTRSEERRVGRRVSVRVDLGGRSILNNKIDKQNMTRNTTNNQYNK